MEAKSKTTIDPAEVEQFSKIADEWWNPRGKFKPLHDMNPVRMEWIVQRVEGGGWMVDGKNTAHQPLQGKALLDIGCGGGLICEPLARLGASVTGIDASQKNIKVASLHAERAGLDIQYRCMSAEELVREMEGVGCQPAPLQGAALNVATPMNATSRTGIYDVVLALEIVEHVADVPLFIESCCKLVRPGGLLIMSTLNRTFKSYAMAIIGAEYVLRILPKGTHEWQKFLKPSELCASLRSCQMELVEMTGMTLNPLSWKWQLNEKDLDVNYLLCARKPA